MAVISYINVSVWIYVLVLYHVFKVALTLCFGVVIFS